MGGNQTAVTADDFNDYFLSIPYNTVANVVSAVSPSVSFQAMQPQKTNLIVNNSPPSANQSHYNVIQHHQRTGPTNSD